MDFGDAALKSRLAERRRYRGPSRLGVDRDLEARAMLNLAAGRDQAVARARARKLPHASRCRDTRVMGYPRQHPQLPPPPTPDAPPAAAAGRNEHPAAGKACTSMSAKERAREQARESKRAREAERQAGS